MLKAETFDLDPHKGMPPLAPAPPLSFFEFWPARLFYLPVWLWVMWLSVRYRGVRLPLVANPLFPAGGLFGEVKSDILDQITGPAAQWVAPYVTVERGSAEAKDVAFAAMAKANAAGLDFPLVAKPELGCRGAGVRPVHNRDELAAYVEGFPKNEHFLLQKLVDVEGEAGVFYVRRPGAAHGEIISLTLKYFPYVLGDGLRSIEQLIRADPRAGRLTHLYFPRHTPRLNDVLPAGERFRLAFAGSHSRGAIFRNGTALVTEAMRARFDAIAATIPEFWFGRFDVRFADFADLQRGEGFSIVECNGAGAESTHVWDSRTSLPAAYAALFRQYELLWQIGAANRRRGFKPESWTTFLARRRRELNATPAYPMTA